MMELEIQKTETEKEKLKKYLGQYYRVRTKKKQLQKRLNNIQVEKLNPMTGNGYSATPRSNTNSVNDGPAALLLIKQEEIEERIKNQQNKINMALLNVMNIMEYLPLDSKERTIMEYRHIDCLPWKCVERESHMSRTQCYNYYSRGLDLLLEFKKIQKIIYEFTDE